MPLLQSNYIGRFAPSPTGPLHFGSIVASLGSYIDARFNKGTWLLRMDDLDTTRVETGADDRIYYTLDKLGMHWDGEVIYQSRRTEAYHEAEQELESKYLLYPCYCSRKIVGGQVYPGTCRDIKSDSSRQHSIRIKTNAEIYIFHDHIQQDFSQNLHTEVGDFNIRRSDGIYAYHLAVALDDAHQKVSHIVRGADLMDSSPRQIFLQQELKLVTPVYAHLPVALSASGQKICKQHKAEDVLLNNQPAEVLLNCLDFLGQEPPGELLDYPVEEVIQWGIDNWRFSSIPALAEITAPAKFPSLGN
jgi:glutamyl-Q tRNA(Asp) synthetase